ncbi:MAG: radical SAM protein [Bdellovibrionales bacterium]|jgi:MoaA/NifB/PqqE/SkfB family radical SAM enzyme|nr:radical SAM protein [Bdellovibrionales bacterium]
MIYDFFQVNTIHLEITDKCNARCPMCARNENGGKTNHYLSGAELNLSNVKSFLPKELISRLSNLIMCGNYGDPAAASETLEIFEWVRSLNPNVHLSINTNGSLKSELWWSKLAKIFAGQGHVTFGIDGLVDTNKLYRQNVDYTTVIRNAKSFISAGGRARWEFIVFKHNEHQVDEAKLLSSSLGFENFQIKKTGRFFSNTRLAATGQRPVLNLDSTVSHYISPPSNPEFQNRSLQKETSIKAEFGSMEAYLNHTKIKCKVSSSEQKSLYISSEGLVFPCCWLGNQIHLWYLPKFGAEIWTIIKRIGGVEKISLFENDMQDILTGDFFDEIENSWSCNSVRCGKLTTCSKTCGEVFDQYTEQYN